MEEFAKVMERVCPNALLLNYSNPMAMLTSYMLRYTDVKTVGLCHSVQICSETLLKGLGMEDKLEGRVEYIAGINHMAWLLSLHDKDGNDLYPEIKKRAATRTQLKSTMTWSAMSTSSIWDITAPSPANIMQSTIRSSSRRGILSW
jgi:alpha-galactosidase